jgi:uncharacterized protein YcsI (UPF0317 family)
MFRLEMVPLVRASNNLKECAGRSSGYISDANPLVCQKQLNLKLRHRQKNHEYCILQGTTTPGAGENDEE